MSQGVALAKVIVNVRAKTLDKPFDYLIPSDLRERVVPGAQVEVSFGRQTCVGYVLATSEEVEVSELGLKPIGKVLSEVPSLTEEQLGISAWMRHRYACTWMEAISAILPAPLRTANANPSKTEAWLEATVNGEDLEAAVETTASRAKKQAVLLQLLLEYRAISLAEHGFRPSDSAVTALVERGLASMRRHTVYREPAAALEEAYGMHQLTELQAEAVSEITRLRRSASGEAVLIHGVTGSGKTEVYLQAIAACLEDGGQALVLVPEISLTPQMVGRFTSRFGKRVAVLHSALSSGERHDEWMRIRKGEAHIAIGARSAVFAPMNPTLIIVDEEHEASYKQEDAPRYDAREVARWRSDYNHGVAVYGSATPSMVAMHWVEHGAARLVSLPVRVNRSPLPPVTVVDMREELKAGNRSLFSRALKSGLEQAIDAGGQAVLFLNRRGYSSFVLCRKCGEAMVCPHCDITLTLHKSPAAPRLVCHYCQYSRPYDSTCSVCKEEALRPFGIGTQQVEEHLATFYPHYRVLRLDVDTTRRKGAYQEALQTFLDGRADVLLGTQMIAKGLDFPNVAFVGVISADTMLFVPDYRSAERTFSLLTQVSGRAGRAQVAGNTVIQTFRPEHYSILAAASHDYATFYRQERQFREVFGYPPFCEIAVFVAVHQEERLARGAASRFERELKRALMEVIVLPASPSGLARVQDQYRYQVVIKYSRWNDIQAQVVCAFHMVYDKMHKLGGYCTLDVNAGRF